jgi:hypothetical protein
MGMGRMTNTNIKFQLVKFKKALAFQIHEQTELWRRKSKINENIKRFSHSAFIKIISDCVPNIYYNHRHKEYFIELRGTCNYLQNKIMIFKDIERYKLNIDDVFNTILDALKEWSQYVYKITNREPQEPKEFENGIYEF